MKLVILFGIIVVTVLVTLYTWPKIAKDQHKEKRSYIVLMLCGFVLSVLLMYFPKLPGPTELIDWIFEPMARVLE
ncbi:hypothetical protein [Virgibacillus siamensis]|uniref:hypothetical protein n=1 Tax=Virgibacillus siamensis TaxID=480071 RepID=UPI0009847263|nr:hypothetical protein [Virgibacillus siamensis]